MLDDRLDTVFFGTVLEAFESNYARSVACQRNEVSGCPISFDAIVIFIYRIGTETADSMPDVSKMHVPLCRMRDGNIVSPMDFGRIYPQYSGPSFYHFSHVRMKYCPHIMVRKSCPYKIYTVC